jgi:FKBP-type peptidyl-prolyl cis-trans isomerase FkpA
MNKKHFFILAIAALSFTMWSCLKSDENAANNCISNNTGVPTTAEIASLQAYLTSKSITATQHPDGFFYVIQVQGTGVSPQLSSTVNVKYTGKLTNDVIFDENQTGTNFLLSSLILGWRRGLPLIQEGGKITLYLPPSLGYGCTQTGTIPPGSNLIFTIDLIDVL